MRDKFLERFNKRFQRTNQLAADLFKCLGLLDQHLKSCGDDLTLLTVKGHLIIESLLETNLCRLLDIESLPKKYGRLDFNQKLQLVQLVIKQRGPGPNSPNSDLCLAIDKLNQIRNQLAHNLKSQIEIQKDINDFIREYRLRGDKKLGLGQTTAEQLKGCIHGLCEFLFKARVHFIKLEQQSDE